MRRILVGIGLLAGLCAAAAAFGAWWLATQLEPASPGSRDEVAFSIERGRGLRQVANGLERAALIQNADAAVVVGRLRGWDASVKAGEYDLSPGSSTEDILQKIIQGRVRTYTAVLPEGIRATEIAARLEKVGLVDPAAFLQVVEDAEFAKSLGIQADSLEGYLYPETYEIPGNLPPKAVARILVEQFEAAWAEVEPEAAEIPLDKHEIVILASIVEKETAAPEERPLIAAVFLNRMRKGMRLETDPTVIYGIENFDGNLRRRHLTDASNPYNTYQIRGLPPGPIASPGADALRAVVKPAETDYLYFVSRNDGTHKFSKTYREHVNAVNRYQRSGNSGRRRSK